MPFPFKELYIYTSKILILKRRLFLYFTERMLLMIDATLRVGVRRIRGVLRTVR